MKVRQSTISLEELFSYNFFYTDYSGEMTKCSSFFINPKCVCAYEMYMLGIYDICGKTEPRGNGSLDHVSGKITCANIL